jgi:hypothetical protein
MEPVVFDTAFSRSATGPSCLSHLIARPGAQKKYESYSLILRKREIKSLISQ